MTPGIQPCMNANRNSAPTRTGGFIEDKPKDDGVTNDSLGTVDPADSTGLDDKKEIDNAKNGSQPSRTDSSQA